MMRTWWQAQSERDRRTLAVGAFAVALLLGWALVWHPLALRRDALDQQLKRWRQAQRIRDYAAAITAKHGNLEVLAADRLPRIENPSHLCATE